MFEKVFWCSSERGTCWSQWKLYFICNFSHASSPITAFSSILHTSLNFKLLLSRSFLLKKLWSPCRLWQHIQKPWSDFQEFYCLDLLVPLYFQFLFSLIPGHFKYPAFTFPIKILPVLSRPCSITMSSLKFSLALQTHCFKHILNILFITYLGTYLSSCLGVTISWKGLLSITRCLKFLGGRNYNMLFGISQYSNNDSISKQWMRMHYNKMKAAPI